MSRICITAPQVPFLSGGAELLVDQLAGQLGKRGHDVEVVTLPFVWSPTRAVLEQALAWRLVDLTRPVLGKGTEAELVIATKFPSYLVRHPNKVVWKVHLQREIYDLHATRFGPLSTREEDQGLRQAVVDLDLQGLGECRELFAISGNVAARVERYLGLRPRKLYPPPKLKDRLHVGSYGDYFVFVGRLDAIKRVDLTLEALARTRSPARLKVAGKGPELESLRRRAEELRLGERVEFLGYVDDDDLVDLLAGCCGVVLTPHDEDYGFTTLEAFFAGKPVVTTDDSGGVLEFVDDGVNGYVVPPEAPALASRLDELFDDRERCRTLGMRGHENVRGVVDWDIVCGELTSTLTGG